MARTWRLFAYRHRGFSALLVGLFIDGDSTDDVSVGNADCFSALLVGLFFVGQPRRPVAGDDSVSVPFWLGCSLMAPPFGGS